MIVANLEELPMNRVSVAIPASDLLPEVVGDKRTSVY
jgi:hypothetical protein